MILFSTDSTGEGLGAIINIYDTVQHKIWLSIKLGSVRTEIVNIVLSYCTV